MKKHSSKNGFDEGSIILTYVYFAVATITKENIKKAIAMVGQKEDANKEKIYLDTFVFMDILSGNEEYAGKAKMYLEKTRSGAAESVISSILLAELAFHLKRKRGTEKAEEILYYIRSLPNLSVAPVTAEIAKQAGLLRARYMRRIDKKLTYFDCIHLATAIEMQCKKFVTGDRGFRDIKEIQVEIY